MILHALTTRHPGARYVATLDARITLAILPWLSDGMRDAVLGWLMGL